MARCVGDGPAFAAIVPRTKPPYTRGEPYQGTSETKIDSRRGPRSSEWTGLSCCNSGRLGAATARPSPPGSPGSWKAIQVSIISRSRMGRASLSVGPSGSALADPGLPEGWKGREASRSSGPWGGPGGAGNDCRWRLVNDGLGLDQATELGRPRPHSGVLDSASRSQDAGSIRIASNLRLEMI